MADAYALCTVADIFRCLIAMVELNHMQLLISKLWTVKHVPINDRYEGKFSNNLKDGFGSYEWPDGTKYEGNFKEDRKDGFGIYYFYNGDKYEGNFKEDRFHGNGTYQVS